ncbi:TolC family protein [Tautonia marina]|uniref:TolC family protein n=1 Tax=Tautonia marina TaxID=2653855 RepID=UPI0013759A48|nr:TolC family protein [Tautonia marina]
MESVRRNATRAAQKRTMLGLLMLCVLPEGSADPSHAAQEPFDPPRIELREGMPSALSRVRADAPSLEIRNDLPPLPPVGTSRSTDIRLRDDPGSPLVPDQPVLPIDLANALRLAGARDIEIQIARQRVAEALGELQLARSAWLPSIFYGPQWMRHDGQAQIVEGPVQTISKSSLFVGGMAALGDGISGPVPAGGPPNVGGFSTILRLSDAIFLPMAARRVVDAERAGVSVAVNNAILGVAEAYFDLQAAAGRLSIASEAARNAEVLVELTSSFAESGLGLEADYRRSLVERDLQRREVAEAVGMLEIASAELIRRTRLDPSILVAPVEPPESILRLIPDDTPPDALITTALLNRPELAEQRKFVEATLIRLKQARLRPFVPSLSTRVSGGGYGGGRNDFFGNFDGRFDTDVNVFWELRGLGVGDAAYMKMANARNQEAKLRVLQIQDRVAAEVIQAEKMRLAAARQITEAERAVPDAIRSLELNLANIRRGAGLPEATRPIEVLQPIQALARARQEYLDSVLDYNRSQFRLYAAMGRPETLPSAATPTEWILPPAVDVADPIGPPILPETSR